MKRCLACLLCLLLRITALPVSAAEVNVAISIGLVPEELQSDYQQDITRDEFAQLAVTLCMAQLRYVGSPEQFLEDYRRYFRDEVGNTVDAVPAEFPDLAAESIGWMRYWDVMEGDNYGNFMPQGHLTREQAILIFLRLAREVHMPEIGLVPYEEELTRTLDGFTPAEQLESKAAAALLGTDADGHPQLWVAHGTGGRSELYGKLEEEIPGITAVDLLSLAEREPVCVRSQ